MNRVVRRVTRIGDPVEGGSSTGDLVEDPVSGSGPDGGLGVAIPVGDPAVDPGLRVRRQVVARRRYSCEVRPLRYSINVTLDGCCDHRAIPADEDLHRHATENLNQADALVLGRVTYEMMESAWRPPAPAGARPEWMEPFAQTINAAKKYVVSSTLEQVDWNAELVRGDLDTAVRQLKRESGKGLFVGGVKLPLALTELGLIDDYEFVVHPRLAGHGPTLFAGLSKHVDLKLVSRLEFGSGAVAMRYEPRR
jgi:dihydrofolate reductase